jgi:hypothetical protein
MAEQSLTDALLLLGITHKRSAIEGRQDWFDKDGKPLGSYDAQEGWEMLAIIQSMGNAVERALQRQHDEDEAADREHRPSVSGGTVYPADHKQSAGIHPHLKRSDR